MQRAPLQRGVQMIATAHGHTLENLMKNPSLNDLVGGVVSVTLGDDEARRRRVQKSVLEREGPPTFGAAVEMNEIGQWRVHLDVGVAVDTLLAGYAPPVELRTLEAGTGRVRVQPWLGGGGGVGGGFGAMFGPGGPVGGGVGFGGAPADAFGGGGDGASGVAGYGMGIPGGIAGMPTGLMGGGGSGYQITTNQQLQRNLQQQQRQQSRQSSSSGLAAQEVAAAAAARQGLSPSATTSTSSVNGHSGDEFDEYGRNLSVFCIYPYELDCEMLEEVIASLGLTDRVALTNVLEEASAVLAVKSQVKNATWLRHAARARGMPIYALKLEGMPQLARAMQAMLGLTLNSSGVEGGAVDGDGGDGGGVNNNGSSMAAAAAAVAGGGGGVGGGGRGGGGSGVVTGGPASGTVSATATAQVNGGGGGGGGGGSSSARVSASEKYAATFSRAGSGGGVASSASVSVATPAEEADALVGLYELNPVDP
jgi:hypothetical protein